jgi:hypothetical protein
MLAVVVVALVMGPLLSYRGRLRKRAWAEYQWAAADYEIASLVRQVVQLKLKHEEGLVSEAVPDANAIDTPTRLELLNQRRSEFATAPFEEAARKARCETLRARLASSWLFR